jgi:hypothetical protein
MRQITSDSLEAFIHGRNFSRQNMVVESYTDGTSYYCLHGHVVAKRESFDNGGDILLSACGWFTPTTKDRINAVLDAATFGEWHVYSDKGDWVLWSRDHGESLPFDERIVSVNKLRALSQTIHTERLQRAA